ncbi:MAG: hypothetical protein QOD12_1159 [Verrucomicrobiota bacterium]|jgi:hypothetical protein
MDYNENSEGLRRRCAALVRRWTGRRVLRRRFARLIAAKGAKQKERSLKPEIGEQDIAGVLERWRGSLPGE